MMIMSVGYKIFLLITGLIFQLNVFAQVGVGIRGGLNISNVSGNEYKAKPGFHVGTVVDIPVNERFTFQPEAVFSQKGGTTKVSDQRQYFNSMDGNYYKRRNLIANYVDINALGRVNVTEGLYFLLGPQFSVLFYDRYKYNNGDGEKDVYNFTEGTRRIDLGIAAGAGYEFDNGWFVGIRREFGLLPVFQNGASLRNSVFQLTGGFKVQGGRRFDPTTLEDVSVNE
jgi:hypothetical protein